LRSRVDLPKGLNPISFGLTLALTRHGAVIVADSPRAGCNNIGGGSVRILVGVAPLVTIQVWGRQLGVTLDTTGTARTVGTAP